MARDLHSHDSCIICEAVDCYDAATEEIEISAGIFGTIILHLCHECSSSKFGDRRPEN